MNPTLKRPTYYVAPEYCADVGISPETLVGVFAERFRSALTESTTSMELLDRLVHDPAEQRYRVGLTCLYAQFMANAATRAAEDAGDVLEIKTKALELLKAVSVDANTNGERLQLAQSYLRVGEVLNDSHYHSLSIDFLCECAELYIRQVRWPMVAKAYELLAIAEGSIGEGSGSIGWWRLSADIWRTVGDKDGESHAEEQIRFLRDNEAFVCACIAEAKRRQESAAMRDTVTRRLLAHDFVGSQSELLMRIAPNLPEPMDFVGFIEGPGDDMPIITGTIGGAPEGWRFRSTPVDIILPPLRRLYEQNWPSAMVSAQGVDLRICQRLLANHELFRRLEPRALEVLLERLFRGLGATTRLTPQTRDGGFDVEARFALGGANFRVLIETKLYTDRKVTLSEVDRYLGVKYRTAADRVVIVTTSDFTTPARRAVAHLSTEVELVDRDGLIEWIRAFLLPMEDSRFKLPNITIAPPLKR